jgi:hypothetical protein
MRFKSQNSIEPLRTSTSLKVESSKSQSCMMASEYVNNWHTVHSLLIRYYSGYRHDNDGEIRKDCPGLDSDPGTRAGVCESG